MRYSITTLVTLVGSLAFLSAQDPESSWESEKEKVSYALGYNIGINLQRQGYEIDPEVLSKAVSDVMEGNDLAMTENEARTILQAYHQTIMEEKRKQQDAVAEENRKKGAEWLAANARKEGVVTLDSGLQYKVLTEGSGESPGPRDSVKARYRGTLIDGTEFDGNLDAETPAQFNVGRVIPGWTEALQLMKPGSKWQLFIPNELAYGSQQKGPVIAPGSALVFEVELLEVIRPQPITSDIIKVPSAEEMKKGAKIETIKASDLKRLEEEARKANEEEGK